MFALARQQNHGRTAAALHRFAQQLHTVARAEPIIDQTNIVPIFEHGFEAVIESLDPIDLQPPPFHLIEEAARQHVIVFVVFDEQDF